jgi:hypothetical protein
MRNGVIVGKLKALDQVLDELHSLGLVDAALSLSPPVNTRMNLLSGNAAFASGMKSEKRN